MQIQVLDKGYVKFVESWGGGLADEAEAGIVEAARQSTQGSFRGWDTDQKLLGYLFNSKPQHATPFEFAGMVIEVQAPILVFREWHRHRTQSYNEMSARYAPLPDDYYGVTLERCMLANSATTNKQAQNATGTELTELHAGLWLDAMKAAYAHCEAVYQDGLRAGIPKEVARVVMPVGHYSRMRSSANLRNWLAFMTLRMDPNAQWEIRQFANAVAEIIAAKFPQTYRLYAGSAFTDEG